MIKIEKVSKKIDNNLIIDNLSIDFYKGNIYGLIGRNGSGKTVLLKMICGFMEPTSGQILIDQVNYFKKHDFPQNIRAMIENPKFISGISGFENLKLLADINKKITDEDIKNIMKKLNLFPDKDKKYSKYSLGMKQKLAIAQVVMEKPEIMVFDEPFNGIDYDTLIEIKKLLKILKKGRIIIISTNAKEDLDICDEIYKIEDGRVKKIGRIS